MKVVTQAMDFTRDTHELGVLFCTEGDWASSSLGKTLNEKLGDVFRSLSESGEFRALAGETALLHTAGTLPTRRLLLTGLGPDETVDAEALRRATAAAARRARGTRVPTIAFMLPESPRTLAVETAAQAVVEGAMIALHSFNEYYTEATAETPVTEIRVGAPGSRMTAEVGEGARRGEAYASASNWARDLSIHPANVLTPRRLAQEARALASLGGVTVEVKDETWIAEMRMGGLLAVTRGSEEPPRFIIVDYHPDGHTGAPVVLVGKGVTFDSGGLSLKDRESMKEMKGDMGGAAAVLGAVRVAAELGFPVRVVALVPATENLPDGKAFRPSDIITMMSGKTVEIISTDAEGRMILADALCYAGRYQPAAVVDIATLTAAVVIALGHVATGVMGKDATLVDKLRRAGETTGERVWEFPLWPDFREQLRSEVCDLKNSGGRQASAITAGLFLAEFADGYPWAHLDIAGTSNVNRDISCFSKGTTGVGVRLLAEFLRSWEG